MQILVYATFICTNTYSLCIHDMIVFIRNHNTDMYYAFSHTSSGLPDIFECSMESPGQ